MEFQEIQRTNPCVSWPENLKYTMAKGPLKLSASCIPDDLHALVPLPGLPWQRFVGSW